jgi:archaellum biogenesis protein FlaJ (TadC family)
VILKAVGVTSFVLIVAFATLSVAVVSQVDPSITAFAAAAAVVLVAVAVLTGVAMPEEGLDKLWKRLALPCVKLASRTGVHAVGHIGLMAVMIALIYSVGPALARCTLIVVGVAEHMLGCRANFIGGVLWARK